jgi:uncharacterized membrane protein
VTAVLERGVRAEGPQERLLEGVVGGVPPEQASQLGEHGAFLLLVEPFERGNAHELHHPYKRKGRERCEMPTSATCILGAMPPKVQRQGLAGRRLLLSLAAGLAVVVIGLVAGGGWSVALTAGWGAVALVTGGGIWLRVQSMDPAETAAHAQAEDYSAATSDSIVLGASVASLVAVGSALIEARHQTGTDKGLLILLAVFVVAVSWTAIHLVFTVRYGDLYYGDPVGGVGFNEEERPDYRDFAYFALTIGMTFQVSDTSITDKSVRRLVTRHALLSYLFGAVIVALAINTVASLLQ